MKNLFFFLAFFNLAMLCLFLQILTGDNKDWFQTILTVIYFNINMFLSSLHLYWFFNYLNKQDKDKEESSTTEKK
jgi:hypothetical protein